MPRPRKLGTTALSGRLALASLGTAIAIGVVCAVGLSSLENTAAVARVAVTQQLALIDDAAAMSAFQYQKGFVAEYLLSGNRAWLAELETSRPAFESWLAAAHGKVANPGVGASCSTTSRASTPPTIARARTAIALYDSGRRDEARASAGDAITRARSACGICSTSSDAWRAQDAERTLADTERSVGRLAHVLVGTSIAGAIASLLVGFLWARRITRPIYELEVQVQSRDRANAHPGGARPRRPGGAGRPGERPGREAGRDRRGAGRAPAAPDAEREAVGGRRAGGQAGARGAEPAGGDEGGRAAAGPARRRRRRRAATWSRRPRR